MVKQAELPTAPGADPALKDITDFTGRSPGSPPPAPAGGAALHLDLSFEEMGQTLDISAQAAKSRLHRVLNRLRAEVPEVPEDE